jgi:hypothetical protein
MCAESDTSASTKKITSEGESAAHEQAHTYESINDPTTEENSHHDMNYNEVHHAKSTVSRSQSLTIAKFDKSNWPKQQQPHLQLNTISCTNPSSSIPRQHKLVPSRSRDDTSQCLHAESYQNNQDEKTPCSDVNQIAIIESESEENTHSCDNQVDKRGQYDQICQYERISRYEKVPHCDLSFSQRNPCSS